MSAGRSGGRRADRGDPTRILRLGVLRLLADRVGVAGGHEAERAERVDLEHRDLVGDAADVRRDPIGHRRPDAVPHLGRVAMDRDLPVRIDLRPTPASSPLQCRSSWRRRRRLCRRGFPPAHAPSPRRGRARSDAARAYRGSPAFGGTRGRDCRPSFSSRPEERCDCRNSIGSSGSVAQISSTITSSAVMVCTVP